MRCCRCSTHSEAEDFFKKNLKSHLWTTAKTLAARRCISRPQVPYWYIKISVKGGPEIFKAVLQTSRAHAADPLLAPCTLLPCWLLLIEILFLSVWGFFFFFSCDWSHREQRNKSAPVVAFYGNVLLSVTNTAGWQISMSHMISVGVGDCSTPVVTTRMI